MKALKVLVIVVIILDLCYSGLQHLAQPMDGDIARIVVPNPYFEQVLSDPFGWTSIRTGQRYGATNRYTVHQTMYTYFRSIPIWLQHFTPPIESLYYAAAIFKLLMQILLLLLIVKFASIHLEIKYFWIGLLLMFPLFQQGDFNSYIGFIPNSISYAFAYTFPMVLLLLTLWPLYESSFNYSSTKYEIRPWIRAVLMVMTVVLAFSGPLIGPVVILITGLYFLRNYLTRKEKSWTAFLSKNRIPFKLIFLVFFSTVCLYSFYVGLFNMENSTLPLGERYTNLFKGLMNQLTQKLAYGVLLIGLGINFFLLNKVNKDADTIPFIELSKWLALFIALYLLLLPLGGYRDYRALIVRSDTMLPVNIILVFLFVRSSLLLLNGSGLNKRVFYQTFLIAIALFFTIADGSDLNKNACEKEHLEIISKSQKTQVELNANCSILEWSVISDPSKSVDNGKLLKLLKITSEEKTYFTLQ